MRRIASRIRGASNIGGASNIRGASNIGGAYLNRFDQSARLTCWQRGSRRCLAAVLSLSIVIAAPLQICLPAAAAPNFPPPPAQPLIPSKEPAIKMEVRPAAPPVDDLAARVAHVKPLDPDKLQQLVKRLPAMTAEPSENTGAQVSGEAVFKPNLGVKVEPSFPPSGQAPVKPTVATEALRVIRVNAEGTFSALKELSVSFSQPMVALSDLNSVNDAANIPVRLTPQPEGKWRWVDSQTLIFKPNAGELPKATIYKGTVASGTASINGGKLEQPRTFEFNLPAPSITQFVPQAQVDNLQPTILALFDQKIDPVAVRQHLRATVSGAEKKGEIELQPVSQQQALADETLKSYVARVDPSSWLALKPSQALPLASTIKISLTAGCPSKEGPLTTKKEQKFSFSTYGPLKITERPARAVSPQSYLYVSFSNLLDDKKFNPSMVHITPSVPNFTPRAQAREISLSGDFKARTNYKISFSANISDIYGQKLNREAVAALNTGDINPSLTGLDAEMRVIPFGKPATLKFTAQGVPKVEVEILAVEPKNWYTFAAFTNDDENNSEAGRTQALPPPPPPVSAPPRLPGAPQAPAGLEPPPPHAPPRPVVHRARPSRQSTPKHRQLPFKRLALKVIPVGQTIKNIDINLQPYLSHGLGHLVVLARTVGTKPDESIKLRSWVQVTKIGLDAYRSKDLVAVASSLDQGRPLAGMQMQLLPQRTKAVTDSAGIARLKLDNDAKHSQWLVATNAQGSDSAILTESNDATGETGWAKLTADPFYQWSLFTDRGLYRPGETVQIKGWARKLSFGENEELLFSGVPDAKASYVVTGSDGSQIGKGSFPIDNHGGFSFAIKLSDKVNLGSASVSIESVFHAGGKGEPAIADSGNSVSFDIQEFRRPQFQLNLTSATGTSTIFDQPASVTAEARYYAAGALRNSAVKWEVSAAPTSYSPPNWTDYSFGGQTLESMARTDFANFGVQKDLQTTTDASGRSAINLSFPFLAAPLPVSCVCQATVQDIDRHDWSDRLTLLVHPAQVYVGLKAEDNYQLPVGYAHQLPEPLKTKVVVTDLDGHVSADKTVHLRLVLRSDQTNEFKTVEERDIQSGAEPVEVSFPVKTAGSYQVVALVADDHGRRNQTAVDMTVSEPVEAVESSNDMQNLRVETDKKDYQPGEAAKILIHSPFAPAHGIVTVHKQCIMQTIPIEMDKLTKTITVPVTNAFYPNINVDVNLSGKDSMMAYGSTVVSVPPRERKLDVKVEPVETEVSPGADTTLNIALKTADGNPVVDGQVAIGVVDEALLALNNYVWPDLLSVFYPSQDQEIGNRHSRADIKVVAFEAGKADFSALPPPSVPMPGAPAPMEAEKVAPGGRMYLKRFAPAGAGGAAEPAESKPISMRSNFSSLALFEPSVTTDANGKATVKFHLPDSVTRYRIMVAAVAGTNAFGSGQSSLTARLPLMVKPSAPRFLNFGDQCELPVVLQNQTDKELNVEVVAEAVNAELGNATALGGGIEAAGQSVGIPAHDRVEVKFPVSTRKVGSARFQLAAAAENCADAAQISLPVLKPASQEAFATYGTIDDGAVSQTIVAPHDVIDDLGGLEISTCSTQVQTLTDATISLEDYSYECSEQLSARLLGVLSMRGVLSAFGKLSDDQKAKIDEAIKKDIKTLLRRERADGGFGLWNADESTEWPYVSLQVIRALQLAKQHNYEVPVGQSGDRSQYLLHVDRHLPKDMTGPARLSVQAYALYLRYLQNQADPQAARKLVREGARLGGARGEFSAATEQQLKNGLEFDCVGWLLPILASDKQPVLATRGSAEYEKLQHLLDANIMETAATASVPPPHYQYCHYYMFDSQARSNAIVLDCLMEMRKDSPLIPKFVKGLLLRRKNGQWETTQENAYILIVLSKYFARYEREIPDFLAQLWLNDTYFGATKFAGRTTETKIVSVPMTQLVQNGGKQTLLVNKEGAGRLYYRVGLDYIPRQLSLPAADYGFAVTRTYEGVDDKSDARKDDAGVWHFKAGATIRVKLAFDCTSARYHVALVDPLAAGTESVNPDLAGNRIVPEKVENDSASQIGAAPMIPWHGSWFELKNFRDNQTEAFAPCVWGGKYDFDYMVRATTPGKFVVPPCKAEEMYAPETFGRTASDTVLIE